MASLIWKSCKWRRPPKASSFHVHAVQTIEGNKATCHSQLGRQAADYKLIHVSNALILSMFELHGPEVLCENGHGTAEERIGMHSLCSVQNHGLKNQVQNLTVAMRHLFGGQLWESRCVFSLTVSISCVS